LAHSIVLLGVITVGAIVTFMGFVSRVVARLRPPGQPAAA
jgi:hypothetical protein